MFNLPVLLHTLIVADIVIFLCIAIIYLLEGLIVMGWGIDNKLFDWVVDSLFPFLAKVLTATFVLTLIVWLIIILI